MIICLKETDLNAFSKLNSFPIKITLRISLHINYFNLEVIF